MAILLSKLIDQLPPDTEKRVQKSKDLWNTRIREGLRRETRLTLHRHDESHGSKDEIISVPITVCAGLPEDLQPLESQITEEHELALLLAPYRHIITSMRDSTGSAIDAFLPSVPDRFRKVLFDGREAQLPAVREYAQSLLDRLKAFDLTKFILKVNADVLGVYRYKVWKYLDDPQPKIELYWGVIGLIARDLGIDVEQLTCVVLAHELAHAYTHVGSDADDQYWLTTQFRDSELSLKEGLAQYYGWLVCKRLNEQAPGILTAYESLLEKQPAPYHAHEPWTKDFTPEHVRLAMLHVRRYCPLGELNYFSELLNGAKDQLPKATRARKAGAQG